MNSIYVQIEPLYGADVCEVSNLNTILEYLEELAEFSGSSSECVTEFRPHNDLLDPVSDYALRSFAFGCFGFGF